MTSTEATDTPKEAHTVNPELLATFADIDAKADAAEEEAKRVKESGRAVYDRMLAAEAEALEDSKSTYPPTFVTIRITLAEYEAWRQWALARNMTPPALDESQEFHWLKGTVLVVVR